MAVKQKDKFADWIVSYWKGEKPLWFCFWVLPILLSLPIVVYLGTVELLDEDFWTPYLDTTLEQPFQTLVWFVNTLDILSLIIGFALWIVFLVWFLIGLWRSATYSVCKKVWKILVKTLVVAYIIYLVSVFVIEIKIALS